MNNPMNLSPISIREYWTLLKPVEQRNVRKVAIAPILHCEECSVVVSDKPLSCFFCDCIVCPACVRKEMWGEQLRTVCNGCFQIGKDMDDDIEGEGEYV